MKVKNINDSLAFKLAAVVLCVMYFIAQLGGIGSPSTFGSFLGIGALKIPCMLAMVIVIANMFITNIKQLWLAAPFVLIGISNIVCALLWWMMQGAMEQGVYIALAIKGIMCIIVSLIMLKANAPAWIKIASTATLIFMDWLVNILASNMIYKFTEGMPFEARYRLTSSVYIQDNYEWLIILAALSMVMAGKYDSNKLARMLKAPGTAVSCKTNITTLVVGLICICWSMLVGVGLNDFVRTNIINKKRLYIYPEDIPYELILVTIVEICLTAYIYKKATYGDLTFSKMKLYPLSQLLHQALAFIMFSRIMDGYGEGLESFAIYISYGIAFVPTMIAAALSLIALSKRINKRIGLKIIALPNTILTVIVGVSTVLTMYIVSNNNTVVLLILLSTYIIKALFFRNILLTNFNRNAKVNNIEIGG